jgi:hypothetical protein
LNTTPQIWSLIQEVKKQADFVFLVRRISKNKKSGRLKNLYVLRMKVDTEKTVKNFEVKLNKYWFLHIQRACYPYYHSKQKNL